MPYYEVHCPCGTTKSIYRAPGKPAPKYCSSACMRRFRTGSDKPRKYIFTQEMDEDIRRLYQREENFKQNMYKGPIKKLAERFGMPRWRVSRRALELGLLPVQKKEPPWSETELWILKNSAHRSPATVQKYLRRAGYHRSIQGIMVKRKRMHISLTTMNGYTSRGLARLFGVDSQVIARWVNNGWLKARRCGTGRTEAQGGDIWFIRPEWVREFVIANVAVIDFRKLDKYWLVEMLTRVQGLGVQGSEVKEIPEFTEPVEESDVDPDVMDLFDEVQRFSEGVRY